MPEASRTTQTLGVLSRRLYDVSGGAAVKRKGVWFGAVVMVAIVLGLGYADWRISRSSEPQVCQACSRPVHAHSRTVGLVGDRRELFCCPACALTAHDQDGKPVKIVELTDYETSSPLSPTQAYMVRGSDVNMCAQQHGPVGPDKQPTRVHFDRCSPGLLAFVGREAAARFAKEHAGEVLSFSELAASYSR
jgi:hypothetical protein